MPGFTDPLAFLEYSICVLNTCFCRGRDTGMKMKHICRKKLSSQSGVSLSVALLFFVVCAALASMILAAAYAASGRVSKTMSLDQNQYTVDSAAALVSKELQNEVIVIQEKAEVKQNESGEYVLQEQTDSNGEDSTISTSYYEVNYNAASGEGVPTLLEDFQNMKDVKVQQVDSDQTLLVKEYAEMYQSYLSNIIWNDKSVTDKFYQAKLATASLAKLADRKKVEFGVDIDNQKSLSANAGMTLKSDLSLDILVTDKDSNASIHVYCMPDITTTYTYELQNEGDVNGTQIVTKTTVISFGKAKVTRS